MSEQAGSFGVMDFLAGHFDLIRGLHIIFVMAWIAGMLILPRLFVYHMKTEPGSDMDAVFKLAELRTLRIIINPAMILALLMGLLLAMIDTQRLGHDFYPEALGPDQDRRPDLPVRLARLRFQGPPPVRRRDQHPLGEVLADDQRAAVPGGHRHRAVGDDQVPGPLEPAGFRRLRLTGGAACGSHPGRQVASRPVPAFYGPALVLTRPRSPLASKVCPPIDTRRRHGATRSPPHRDESV
jgi:hypothetical protein